MRLGRGLALSVVVLMASSSLVRAEGAAEFDVGDQGGTHDDLDQRLAQTTVLYVDILSGNDEQICWRGNGNITVFRPAPNQAMQVGGTITNNNCVAAVNGVDGAYLIDPAADQNNGTEWDIRVCPKTSGGNPVTAANCFNNTLNHERLGRLWSYNWRFVTNDSVVNRFTALYANNGSVYAIVPGGGADLDAVIEMRMRGVSGAEYQLYANTIGPEEDTSPFTRIGRSVPKADHRVTPSLPLYLNPPEIADYDWQTPVVTDVLLDSSCGPRIVQGAAAGSITFNSNVVGQYVVVCDVDMNSVYDFASQTDFSSFGSASVGSNTIMWTGQNNAGMNAAEGTYNCIVRLNVGEFHYTADDIETSYPGIRMFRVEADKTSRTPIRMFWDDSDIAMDAEALPNGGQIARSPVPQGLDPQSYATADAPFYYNAGTPTGNARAWGNFNSTGHGNESFLDQFAAADTAISDPISVRVLATGSDSDNDGLTNQRECTLGADPTDSDSDGDGVSDGDEATSSTAPNTDGMGPADILDPDSDNDGVDDGEDADRLDPNECRDMDGDDCDDCVMTGANESGGNPGNDGTDTNGDGECNVGDSDDDGDGVPDPMDSAPIDPNECRDMDDDACDDCAMTGADGSGGDPAEDGDDNDDDGLCDEGAGTPDSGDPDDDNDGVPDGEDSAPSDPMSCRDTDADGCDDCSISGADESGGDPADDGCDDTDGDGVPDSADLDRDNDGIPDAREGSGDLDGDGTPNALDLDSDGDGLSDIAEAGGGELDGNGDGRIDGVTDSSPKDGLHDPLQANGGELPLPDTDSDGMPDFLDADDDDDGIPSAGELDDDGEPRDTDGDGRPDHRDADDDGDGIPTRDERTSDGQDRDSDGDGTPDHLDPNGDDADGDGIPNGDDLDRDNDGIPNFDEGIGDLDGDGIENEFDLDTDGDGLSDVYEAGGAALDRDDDGRIDELVDSQPRDGLHDPLQADRGALPLPDTDRDGEPDFLDSDDDNDGLPSSEELDDEGRPRDTDDDGVPDHRDADDDDDGLLTRDERTSEGEDRDTDGDGVPDHLDPNDDADADGDGVVNEDDLDRDNDGVPNDAEGDGDADGDGIANVFDLDSDNDGLFDIVEAGGGELDPNEDGRIDELEDSAARNGLHDPLEADGGALPRPDNDGDGTPDFLDVDDDGDGLPSHEERPNDESVDTDDDGDPDYLDPDDDGDGVPTADELDSNGDPRDTDGDGTFDHLDADDDGDGVPTVDERTDDGKDRDTDRDGTPDHLDADDDGDGVPTTDEREDGDRDTDDDGKPDHLDPDDDGDGIPTEDERKDADGNGVPDRLEPTRGTLAGGALCAVERPGARTASDASTGTILLWIGLGLAGAVSVRRRRASNRKRHAQKPGAPALWLLAVTVGSWAGLQEARASAQVALDQFHPAPLASDGFAIGRPTVLPHASVGALLLLDYANDPLVYERRPGDPDSEEHVVTDHLVLHAVIAFGLWDRLALFAGVPVHLIMDGDSELTVAPEAEGAGLGDVTLGARIRIAGDDSSLAALGAELIARLPTADWADGAQDYRGDSIGSYEPALILELHAGAFDVRARAAARFREQVTVGNLSLSQELVYGLGARLRIAKPFYLHAEFHGSTYLNDAFGREHSPAEALAGAKLDLEGWIIGAAAGPGLLRGYGSPDVRVVGMLGYAEPATPPEPPPVDTDRDGLFDPVDDCPSEPEDRDGWEDRDGCPDPDNDRDGILDVSDRCRSQPEDDDAYEDEDGCPDPDNDKDGILDADDRCPLEPEDTDDFEDTDGCADPDNDKDRILDGSDACVDKPEDYDGFEDTDGCPEDGAGLVKLTCERIEITESVYFDTGSDRIQERSFTLLNQVAELLQRATQIKKLRVEGHTDDRGKDKSNLSLSQRRAASVLDYVVERGVSSDRLLSEGFGEARPIADNKTAAGRSQNRRVEFVVVDGEACP